MIGQPTKQKNRGVCPSRSALFAVEMETVHQTKTHQPGIEWMLNGEKNQKEKKKH